MNEYAIRATEAFIQATREENTRDIATRLGSKAFRKQALNFFKRRWDKASDDAIIQDLKTDTNQPGKPWIVFHSFARENALTEIPLRIVKALPMDAYHSYELKTDAKGKVTGQETFLSSLLRRRNLPPEYRAHFLTLPNLPDIAVANGPAAPGLT
jgi:hypothetical protein